MTERTELVEAAMRYVRPLRQYWFLWIVPAFLCTSLAIGYGLFAQDYWLASQQLVVRNESLGSALGYGRFESYDEMKTAEETIHAVAKNRALATSVLQSAGPPPSHKKPNWPSPRNVDDFLGKVSISAPNGAEFGQTEVIQLNVEAESPERAVKLTTLVVTELEKRLNELRMVRFESLESELAHSQTLALERLAESTERLETIEQDLGPDLSELRTLDQQYSGGSGILQQELGRAREALREARRELGVIELQQDHLESVRRDPDEIITVPGSILVAYPALGRLKNGLVDAELRLAAALGQYEITHPRCERVTEEIDQIRTRLKSELDTALVESEFNRQTTLQKNALLEQTALDIEQRISRFTTLRVEYNQLVAEVEQRKKDLATISTQLAEVQSTREAASRASMINPVDDPVVSTDPIGPGTKMLAVGGLACGLAIGIGLVFLVIPIEGGAHHAEPFARPIETPAEQPASTLTESVSLPPQSRLSSSRGGVRPQRAKPKVQGPQRAIEPNPESLIDEETLIAIDLTESSAEVAQVAIAGQTKSNPRSQIATAETHDAITQTATLQREAAEFLEPGVKPRRSSDRQISGDDEGLIMELDELRSEMRSNDNPK